MNKYQEALDTLVRYAHESPNVGWVLIHEENILQELVDRATPKKPPKHDKVVCSTCNSKANYGHPYTEYCCHCGQALDWSE